MLNRRSVRCWFRSNATPRCSPCRSLSRNLPLHSPSSLHPLLRFALRAFFIAALAGLHGCAGSSMSLDVPASELRVAGAPLPLVLVRIDSDTRPIIEHGAYKAFGQEHLKNNAFAIPTLVVAASTLASDLVRTGVAEVASLRADDPPYTLDLEVVHLGADVSMGLASFLVVAPTSRVTATCELRWRLADRNGRVFVSTTTRSMLESAASPLGDTEGRAAELLGKALRQALDGGLPLLLPAVDDYWRRQRMRPRREPVANPLPVPRSSTDR
jgi:hypothetical protein